MKIIMGLGNPGVEYAATRHNAGIMLVDKIQDSRFKIQGEYGWRKHYDAMVCKTKDLWLVKSRDVFMNESGRLLQGLPEGDLYVAHDDLDLKLGEYKIQKGRGPKQHNGVESVENALKTKDFWRIRIGIDNRLGSSDLQSRVLDSHSLRSRGPAARARFANPALPGAISGEEYVLQKFSPDERQVLERVLDAIIEANFRRES